MCDRTQQEVLARLLAFEYHKGNKATLSPEVTKMSSGDYAELAYKGWLNQAAKDLEVINNHNRKRTPQT